MQLLPGRVSGFEEAEPEAWYQAAERKHTEDLLLMVTADIR